MKVIFALMLIVLLGISVTGCLGLGVERVNPLDIYMDDIEPLLKHYTEAITQWKNISNDSTLKSSELVESANTISDKIKRIIDAWDKISAPDKAKQYHLWMRNAMNYDQEAFKYIARYYELDYYSNPDEFSRLKGLVAQMSILKDECLLKAESSFPKEWVAS